MSAVAVLDLRNRFKRVKYNINFEFVKTSSVVKKNVHNNIPMVHTCGVNQSAKYQQVPRDIFLIDRSGTGGIPIIVYNIYINI